MTSFKEMEMFTGFYCILVFNVKIIKYNCLIVVGDEMHQSVFDVR